jgi:hypothetical protein
MAERYEFRVKGRIGSSVAASFDEFDTEVEPAITVLRGPVRDQADLHALLERIQSLGLELVEIRQVTGRRGRSPETPH